MEADWSAENCSPAKSLFNRAPTLQHQSNVSECQSQMWFVFLAATNELVICLAVYLVGQLFFCQDMVLFLLVWTLDEQKQMFDIFVWKQGFCRWSFNDFSPCFSPCPGLCLQVKLQRCLPFKHKVSTVQSSIWLQGKHLVYRCMIGGGGKREGGRKAFKVMKFCHNLKERLVGTGLGQSIKSLSRLNWISFSAPSPPPTPPPPPPSSPTHHTPNLQPPSLFQIRLKCVCGVVFLSPSIFFF